MTKLKKINLKDFVDNSVDGVNISKENRLAFFNLDWYPSDSSQGPNLRWVEIDNLKAAIKNNEINSNNVDNDLYKLRMEELKNFSNVQSFSDNEFEVNLIYIGEEVNFFLKLFTARDSRSKVWMVKK